jgi:hypothetical protein
MPSSFSENMGLAAAPEVEQVITSSGSLATDRPQPVFHLLEKPTNFFNLQAISGQHGVQDRIIEKVIERRLRSSGVHC